MSHDLIWAPWRLAYVTGADDQPAPKDLPAEKLLPGADPDCFLCQCVADADDRGRLVVDRGEHSITVLNRYPYNNGHLLVAPKQHLGRLDEIPAEVHAELCRKLAETVQTLEGLLNAEGFNVGLNLGRVAGAGLPGHLHWHIVPRWNGDTNFMPALGATKVIPQSLEALWEVLTNRTTP